MVNQGGGTIMLWDRFSSLTRLFIMFSEVEVIRKLKEQHTKKGYTRIKGNASLWTPIAGKSVASPVECSGQWYREINPGKKKSGKPNLAKSSCGMLILQTK